MLYLLVFQLVLGDAHQLAGGVRSLEAGDGGELGVVDLDVVCFVSHGRVLCEGMVTGDGPWARSRSTATVKDVSWVSDVWRGCL